VTEVRVRSIRLSNGEPAALRDTPGTFDLAIDFSQPEEDVVAAIQCLLQEAADERWTRRTDAGPPLTT
jgi:hypothetical protein